MKLLLCCLFLYTNFLFAQKKDTNRVFKEIQIGTNFASLIRNPTEDFRGDYITTNQYISLEGIFRVDDLFALRIPIGFGLNNLDGRIVEGGDLRSNYFDVGPDFNELADPMKYQNGPLINQKNWSQILSCHPKCSPDLLYHLRPHYLRFQIGLFPSFILHDSKYIRLSVTAGANFGIMDEYAISEYSSFSSVIVDDTIRSWKRLDKAIEYESNPYVFARGEFLCGIDFKISERFSINFEMGFTHRITSQGKKPDKIYTNLDNAGYNLVFSDYKDTELPYYNSLEYPVTFGNDIFINRFSLRYRLR